MASLTAELLGSVLTSGGANAATISNMPPLVSVNGVKRYEVSTASQLLALINGGNGTPYFDLLNGHVALMNSITLPTGTVMHEIGSNGVPFSGVFIGNGYVIRGATISDTNTTTGFFGEVIGKVENLGVVDSVTGYLAHSWGNSNGALVGWLNGGTLQNVWVSGTLSSTSATYYGPSGDGGLVGTESNGFINNAYANVTVKGVTNCGGLVGLQQSGSIANAYSIGKVSDTSGYSGGLVGSVGGTISHSFYDKTTASTGGGFGSFSGAEGLSNPKSSDFTNASWASPPWAIPTTGWPTLAESPTIQAPWTPPAISPSSVTVNGVKHRVIGSMGLNSSAAIQGGSYTGYVEERAALNAGATFGGEGIHSSYLSAILSGSGVGLQHHVPAASQGEFAALYQKLSIIPTWTGNTTTVSSGESTLIKANASRLAIENYLVQFGGYNWTTAIAKVSKDLQ